MVDTIAAARVGQPLRVHALPHTLAALRQHIFNDLIWPDFSRLPSAESPLVTFHPLEVGAVRHVHGRAIEALPAEHSIPAIGYAVRGPQAGGRWWVFSGDTGPNPAFWQRINQLPVHSLVIETAFSNGERELAHLARHLSPAVLADELDHIDTSQPLPHLHHPHQTGRDRKHHARNRAIRSGPPAAQRSRARHPLAERGACVRAVGNFQAKLAASAYLASAGSYRKLHCTASISPSSADCKVCVFSV